MKYFIDLDNTLCSTQGNNYADATPIQIRIDYVNKLKESGHFITIWTARGSATGVDYSELTMRQLKEWGINYDNVLFGKPDYDIYIDDKSMDVNKCWPVPPSPPNTNKVSKKETAEIVPKGWGKEIIFANNKEYCGKLLCFNKGKRCSMHFHIQKKETWYVSKGAFLLYFVKPDTGESFTERLDVGDIITNDRGHPHQVEALEDDSILFEVSTTHFDEDSYRFWKGD